jgi:hypothetical protein
MENSNPMLGDQPQQLQDRTARWARIPAALRERRQWAITPGTDADKAPRQTSGAHASSTNAGTWTTFEAACTAAAERGWHVGYVFTADDPFSCIDLDVKDDTTPEQMQRFQSIVDHFASYSEFSRSGKGMHILVRANIGAGCKRDRIEVYSQERFLICTGSVYRDAPVEDRQDMLANMVSQMRRGPQHGSTPPPEEPERETDDVILNRAASAANAAKFNALWSGDQTGYGSHSEADLALMGLLSFYSPNNAQVRRLFRMSALGKRTKATKDDRYLDLTLLVLRGRDDRKQRIEHGRAIAERIYNDWLTRAKVQPRSNGTHFRILTDKDLQGLPWPKWRVKNIVPETGVGSIFGDSGTFKSFIALDLLAHISNGQHWFGFRASAAPCIYIPFEGRGGIPKRVAAWRIATARRARPDALVIAAPIDEVTTNLAFITEPMNLRNPMARDKLVETLTAGGWTGGVLCIDTLAQAGGGIDENSSEGMGEMIAIFQELQQRLGGVVLVIHHSGKNKSAGLRGHSSLRGALDFAIECQKPENGEWNEAQIYLDKVKDEQTGKKFPFTMQRVLLGNDSDGEEVTSLVVNQPQPQSIIEHLTAPPTDAQRGEEDDTFVYEWVQREVAEGKYPSGTSLEGQRAAMKEKGRELTQKQLRDAIARLKAKSLLKVAPVKSPSNNAWLRAVDRPTEQVQA